jgi:hypothetical protein
VKNTDSAEQKGYDAGKKMSCIKRYIGVDTQGLPHAIAITTSEVTDRSGALQAIDRCRPNLARVESVLVDVGYTGQPFTERLALFSVLLDPFQTKLFYELLDLQLGQSQRLPCAHKLRVFL